MRCHARFRGLRCELLMADHLDDRHNFLIEWDDDGEPLGETATLPAWVTVNQQEYAPALSVVPGTTATAEPPATRVSVAKSVPTPAEQPPGPPGAEQGWYLSEQGGIKFVEQTAERCGICGHPWHTDICSAMQQLGEHRVECGCSAAAL